MLGDGQLHPVPIVIRKPQTPEERDSWLKEAREKLDLPPVPAPEPTAELQPTAPPKRAPRMQAALDSSYEEIRKAAAEPEPPAITRAPPPPAPEDIPRVRGFLRQGWKVAGKRVPSGSQTRMIEGVKLYKESK